MRVLRPNTQSHFDTHSRGVCSLRSLSSYMSTLSNPQLEQYLQRINVPQRQFTPGLTALAQLQLAHVTHIPFDNLALHHPKARIHCVICCNSQHDCRLGVPYRGC